MSYVVEESDERVVNVEPALRSRFRWRAEGCARHMNKMRVFPSFRWEVVKEEGRWAVVAYQNYARPT